MPSSNKKHLKESLIHGCENGQCLKGVEQILDCLYNKSFSLKPAHFPEK